MAIPFLVKNPLLIWSPVNMAKIFWPVGDPINPFAPGDFAEKCVLKLVEWFSGHCRAIKS